MQIEEKLQTWLIDEYELDVISRQALFQKYLELFLNDSTNTKPFSNLKFYKFCENLIADKLVYGFNKTSRGFGFFIKKGVNVSSEMAVSALYPFGYISYLTAMNLYKIGTVLTDGLYFTTPDRNHWKNLCLKELRKKFEISFSIDERSLSSDYININGLIVSSQSILYPYPSEGVLDEAGSNRTIILTYKKDLVESEWWNKSRIQNIVDLYLDMLRMPQYCGGLNHVITIYKQNFQDIDLFKEITLYLDRKGSIIDKARFGFICDKLLHISTEVIDKWKIEQKDKRGSSRKLIANLEFDSRFDPEWNISINHEYARELYSQNISSNFT